MNTPRAIIVVAGASSGLGAALTLLHAERGDRVVAIARRGDRLQEIVDAGGEVLPLTLDISQPNAPEELVAFMGASLPIRRFYAVAAAPPPKEPNQEDLQAYVNLCFTVWPWWLMSLGNAGSFNASSTFVVVSSLAASIPFPGLDYYSACKAALESWARCARSNFDGRISIVRPGQFDSEFHHGPRALDVQALPHKRAKQMVEQIDRGHDEIVLGGWRDIAASRLASVVSPDRIRRVLFNV